MFGSSLQELDEPFITENLLTNKDDYFQHIIKNVEQLRTEYLDRRKKRSDKVRAIAHLGRTKLSIKPGDICHVRDFRIAETAGSSLNSRFSGPYLVPEVDEKRQQCLLKNMINRQKRICQMIHLKKQNHWENQTVTPSKNDLNKHIHEDKGQNTENNEKNFENSSQEH